MPAHPSPLQVAQEHAAKLEVENARLQQEVDTLKVENRLLKMHDYYFTFGANQLHPRGYVVISAPSSDEARQKMFDTYGPKWSMQYSSAEEAGVEKYGLICVARLHA